MNNQIVKINNSDLSVKEFNGQRVVTFKDIDMLHERVEGTAKSNFYENKKHFIENEDYFIIKKSLKYEIPTLEIPNRGITVLTESGYLMLVKSLQDDLAWKVQRELVNNYFRIKEVVNYQSQQNLISGLNETIQQMQGTIEEYKSICKITCSKKRDYSEYIKKALGINKVNHEYERVKARVFLVLGVKKWEDIDFETSKGIVSLIDESVNKAKQDRPYKQMSYFD
ncbi:ORF6N domain-containing protein [Clostridium cuniculi]|uniref:ORF6N domain-containing protein n=1 Tax=Clostridium cuniculi TaxID=2548455 RepID=UPI001055FE5F|nr:ORF6N domain-containing protein [Clostridium cuniculi]